MNSLKLKLPVLRLVDEPGVGQRQLEIGARLEHVREHHPEQQRDERRRDEPCERLEPDATDGLRVAGAGDARDDGREHQRRDDHLDETQEDVGEHPEVAGDRRGGRRIGCVLVRDMAGDDAESSRDKDHDGELGAHRRILPEQPRVNDNPPIAPGGTAALRDFGDRGITSSSDQEDPRRSDHEEHGGEEERHQQPEPVELALREVTAADEDDVLAAALWRDH